MSEAINTLLKCCRRTEPLIQLSAILTGAYIGYAYFRPKKDDEKNIGDLPNVGHISPLNLIKLASHPIALITAGAAVVIVLGKSVYIVSRFGLFAFTFLYKYTTQSSSEAMIYASEVLGTSINKFLNLNRGFGDPHGTTNLTNENIQNVMEDGFNKLNGDTTQLPDKLKDSNVDSDLMRKSIKNIREKAKIIYDKMLKILEKEEKEEIPQFVGGGKGVNIFLGGTREVNINENNNRPTVTTTRLREGLKYIQKEVKISEITKQTKENQEQTRQFWIKWAKENVPELTDQFNIPSETIYNNIRHILYDVTATSIYTKTVNKSMYLLREFGTITNRENVLINGKPGKFIMEEIWLAFAKLLYMYMRINEEYIDFYQQQLNLLRSWTNHINWDDVLLNDINLTELDNMLHITSLTGIREYSSNIQQPVIEEQSDLMSQQRSERILDAFIKIKKYIASLYLFIKLHQASL